MSQIYNIRSSDNNFLFLTEKTIRAVQAIGTLIENDLIEERLGAAHFSIKLKEDLIIAIELITENLKKEGKLINQ